jgi:hypothetical protein
MPARRAATHLTDPAQGRSNYPARIHAIAGVNELVDSPDRTTAPVCRFGYSPRSRSQARIDKTGREDAPRSVAAAD